MILLCFPLSWTLECGYDANLTKSKYINICVHTYIYSSIFFCPCYNIIVILTKFVLWLQNGCKKREKIQILGILWLCRTTCREEKDWVLFLNFRQDFLNLEVQNRSAFSLQVHSGSRNKVWKLGKLRPMQLSF